MSKLGYTWYPQDWWTSDTYKRLKRFPLVRYAIRELIDQMYNEGKPIEMNQEFLHDDYNINLSDTEFQKLLEFVTVDEDGFWWMDSVKRRLTKAETARQNGKNGGAPKGNKNAKKPEQKEEIKTTQEPIKTTQQNNPNNPSLEIESKDKVKEKEEEEEDKSNISGSENPPPHSLTFSIKPKTFKQLNKSEFVEECKSHIDEFGKETVSSFFTHWSELSATGKMKFQLEKTWETKKRLIKWRNNELSWKK